MDIDWVLIPKGNGIGISAAWEPVKGKMYVLAVNNENKLWLKVGEDAWQWLTGEASQATLVWHAATSAMQIYAVSPETGNLWVGTLKDDQPNPQPPPIPPNAIKLDKLGYGNTNYGYGLEPYSMAAGQKTIFTLPVGEVIARPDYPYYPKTNIHKLNFHTAASPEGNGEIRITLRAPTGEVWNGTNITADVAFNIWSQNYPYPGYTNYQYPWVSIDTWIVEIEAIKNSQFLIWWFPTPEGVV